MQGTGQNLPVPPTPPPMPDLPPLPTLPPWATLPPAVTLLISLGFFAACAVVLYPLVRALGRRLEGRSSAGEAALRAEIDQLRQRVEDVEVMQNRILELEERVDFTERLLANQRREAERLPGS